MNHDVLSDVDIAEGFYALPLRDQEQRFRAMPTGESTKVPDRPINELDALMRCAPGDTPEQTLGQVQAFREAVVDAIEALTPEQRFVIEAIHSERLSIRQLAARLGVKSEGHCHRIVKAAQAALRTQLSLQPLVRERLNMPTPFLPEAPPLTWDTAARQIVSRMRPDDIDPLPPKTCKSMITRKIGELRELINSGTYTESKLGAKVVTIGECAADLLSHLGLWDIDEIVALLCRKQHDYGHGNILSFGMVGVVVRLSDKVARYENLSAKGEQGVAEPLEDALLDEVGYAVIAQMLMDGTFTLNLNPELFPNATIALPKAA